MRNGLNGKYQHGLWGQSMKRESRSNYILRKMQESKTDKSLNLLEENVILRNNVKELQEQLQNAYNRIIELQYVKDKQMELFK